jgi:hypothetical protein
MHSLEHETLTGRLAQETYSDGFVGGSVTYSLSCTGILKSVWQSGYL